jgi:uncharacterized protein (DUF983 family)
VALAAAGSELPSWQRPAPAKYSRVGMSRMALSCPECGEPMRFGFRKVCRRCGAKLVMIPQILHPSHVRVFVAGWNAMFYGLLRMVVWGSVLFAALMLIGKACAPVK